MALKSRIAMAAKSGPCLSLPDGSTVVVVGGGPAAAFFAIRLLRKASATGRAIELVILEKERDPGICRSPETCSSPAGCHYCAGGISPRLADLLAEDGLTPPDHIVEGRVTEVTVHGEWKSFEIPVPEGRKMFSVFRGARPRHRPGRHDNLDSFLLYRAAQEGASIVAADVQDVRYSEEGKPVVTYVRQTVAAPRKETLEADLAVFAAGVNQSPGAQVASVPLYQAIGRLLPHFVPPKIRKSLICEMQADESLLQYMEGEAHFAQYGAQDLRIEMSSLLPKGQIVTIVLLGKSVDEAGPGQYPQLVKRFLEQPHIRRLIPPNANLRPVCLCHPGMTVRMAGQGVGDRVALIGDMAVARLYKDGIFSAQVTASALADCVLEQGIDRESLRRSYWPVVEQIHRDNGFGRIVFFLNRLIFSRPLLSRMGYQALITERKTRPKDKRRLADVMWRTASGDDTYRSILLQMLHPSSVWSIAVGGVLVTIRNYLTERIFGLSWTGFGRYPTGVPEERVEEKRSEILRVLGVRPFDGRPQVERMYSIRIKAEEATVFRQLGKFGDSDRGYFTPRMVTVRRIAGEPNQVGALVRYEVFPGWLSFSVSLEKVVEERYLLYRVMDGFARGGVLAFDIDRKKAGGGFLTIYVAFNFPRGKRPLSRIGWRLFRWLFPGFVHDVIWNHSLCTLKHLVEFEEGVAQGVDYTRRYLAPGWDSPSRPC
ncbi:MAG: hypothetical protein M5U22_20940 [Thermoleophilia bacterium]|nr:hypothetical protein [Thermoleophilia bacterium]